MSEVWSQLVTTFWDVANEIMDGVPLAVISNGGAVVLTVNPATQDLGIGLIFQPLEKSQVEEYREALVGGKALIFYYSPDCTGNSEDIEIKSIVLKGKNADLGGAIEEINSHLAKTGGIKLTGRDLLGGESHE